MKRPLCLVLALLISFCFFGCSNKTAHKDKAGEAVINLGESSIYTEEDRNAAACAIIEDINHDPAIAKIHTINYAGDEWSERNEQDCFSTYSDLPYSDIILFYVDFRAGRSAEKFGLSSNYDYPSYKYTLGKNAQGEWKIISGYCGY